MSRFVGCSALSRLVLGVAVAASLGAGSAFAQAKPKIVIATGIDPSFAHYVVAVKKGFFEKQGIDAELRSFDDGNVALDSVLTGAADIGGTSELGGLPVSHVVASSTLWRAASNMLISSVLLARTPSRNRRIWKEKPSACRAAVARISTWRNTRPSISSTSARSTSNTCRPRKV